MSQIKKGALLDYFNIALTNIVGIVLTPFIIRKLGDSEYGLYTLIGAFVGYIAVLDLGLGNAIVRFIAKFRAEEDKKGEENFLANTMVIYGFISSVIILAGTVCYFNIESIFANSLKPDQMGSAKIMFAILIFNLAISLPGGTFGAICSGYEHFVYPKSLRITRYIIRSITIVAVLFLGGKAVSLVVIDTLMSISVVTANAHYVFKKLNVKIKLHHFDKSLITEVFAYSVWIFVAVLAAKFQWTSGQVILGIVANTTVVAIFAVGVMLGTYYGAFSSAITGVFLPRATKMSIRSNGDRELTDLMIRLGRISFIVLMYILCAFALFGKQFVFLWVGSTYYDAYLIALVIMLAYTVPLVENFGNSVMMAQNKVRFKALLYLSFTFLGMALGYWLALDYGIFGMLTGLMVSWVIVQVVTNIYYHRVLKLDMFRFFKELVYKTWWCVILAFCIGFLIDFIPGEGWFNFILKAFLYTCVYGLLVYNFGIITYEKNLFDTSFKSMKTQAVLYKNMIFKRNK